MANTRETLGEQETLDALVRDELETLEEDGVTYIGRYALYSKNSLKTLILPRVNKIEYCGCYYCQNLTTVIAPNLTTLDTDAFEYCNQLLNIQTGPLTSIGSYAFYQCYLITDIDTSAAQTVNGFAFNSTLIGKLVLPQYTSGNQLISNNFLVSDVDLTARTGLSNSVFSDGRNFTALILRRDSLVTLSNTAGVKNGFPNTPMDAGIGYIYVPNYLVNVYKSDEKWAVYSDQIVSIDEYPKPLQNETITDTWSQIFAAESNGTYANRYHVGDTKNIRFNGANILMEIVGIDKDILYDSNQRAKITWMSKGVHFYYKPNIDEDNPWIDSDLRSHLNNTIFSLIDPTVSSRIQNVRKYTYAFTSNSSTAYSCISSDKIWIPSKYEMGVASSGAMTQYEGSGVTYSDHFNSNEARKKRGGITGQTGYYYLRSQSSRSNYYCINSNGEGNNSLNGYNPICFGFCT